MQALILYAVLVVIGTVVAALIGLFVEREITGGSVAVFFGNFYVSWVITRTVVERMLAARANGATPSA